MKFTFIIWFILTLLMMALVSYIFITKDLDSTEVAGIIVAFLASSGLCGFFCAAVGEDIDKRRKGGNDGRHKNKAL